MSAVNYIKKGWKKYYEGLNSNNATDSKGFWKTVKLFMFDKVTTFPIILLVEKGEIISDEYKSANTFSNFFENGIRSLGMKTFSWDLSFKKSNWDCC